MKSRRDEAMKNPRLAPITLRPGFRRNPENEGRRTRGRTVEVHIRQLVLHGFSHADRRPIAEAIERELSRLLSNQTLPIDSSFQTPRVDGGSFQLEANTAHESSGRNIARAIFGGLRQ
jgi:hypothetical protein